MTCSGIYCYVDNQNNDIVKAKGLTWINFNKFEILNIIVIKYLLLVNVVCGMADYTNIFE